MSPVNRPNRVLVIGAGLAGLAAAQALAPRGCQIVIVEARPRAGGRASSFLDPVSGQLLDACQHVSMGCCTNLAHFFRELGLAPLFSPLPVLHFVTSDGRSSRFGADRLPAPFHLTRSFARAHYLSWADKARIAWGLGRLWLTPPSGDPPFADWLTAHAQTPRTIERFWAVVLVSALNEDPDRVGLRSARKVFVDGFLSHPRGFVVEVPAVPLGRLYGPELETWMGRHGVQLRLGTAVRSLHLAEGRIGSAELRSGEHLEADSFILAVPFGRVLDLLPRELAVSTFFDGMRRLEPSPITSVHLWHDQPVMALPHAVLVGCLGQWVFRRGETAPGEHYSQVVVSAARAFRNLGHDEVARRVEEELRRVFPEARNTRLLRSRVVTEHAATFSAVPGVDALRPPQATPWANLFLAGDWTRTGWPATMEGAVRSGWLAAESLLGQRGRIVRPGLPTAGWHPTPSP